MVRKHFQAAESKKRPPLQNMFDEVYANNERTWNMAEQEAELNKHIHEHKYNIASWGVRNPHRKCKPPLKANSL